MYARYLPVAVHIMYGVRMRVSNLGTIVVPACPWIGREQVKYGDSVTRAWDSRRGTVVLLDTRAGAGGRLALVEWEDGKSFWHPLDSLVVI